MMRYFAHIAKKEDSFLVEFPDLEGCLTEGKTLESALANAKEALDGWLAASCDRNLRIPLPKSKSGKNWYPIEVDLRIEFAVRLRQTRKKKHLSQKDIATKLGISQQAYAKLETPEKTNPSLSTIQRLSRALGIEITLAFR